MKIQYIIIVVLVFLILAFWLIRYQQSRQLEQNFEILLARHSKLDTLETAVHYAFTSVLEEEGVPFRWANKDEILKHQPQEIIKHNPVIIFPDYISQDIPEEYELWISAYIKLGGNVFITYNSGIRMRNERYRDKAVFSSILGLNYITYKKQGEKTFQQASVQFKDKAAADLFEIPAGKLDENLYLTGYQYGKLNYPVAKIDAQNIQPHEIIAYSVHEDGSRNPCIIVKNFEQGSALYVNLPLGYLKAYATDEMPLRSLLRTYLFKIVKIPHLSNMPSHKAGLVINWHVDTNKDWQAINWAEKTGILRKELSYSSHISAGPWLEEPEDNLGFDAHRHKDLVRKLAEYGHVGSLGGWAHNWFATRVANYEMTPEEIELHIRMNNEVLYNITGIPVKEFSAPRGVHFPLFTRIMEEKKINSHYYSGDSGSFPNRSFIDGKRFSNQVFSFPVMTLNQYATVQELGRNNISAKVFENWLTSTLDYLISKRRIALITGHFYDYYDFPQYIKPFNDFLDSAIALQNADKLLVKPMHFFADFWQRFLKTKIKYKPKNGLMLIEMINPESLQNIVLCLPKEDYKKTASEYINITEDDDYYYIEITEDIKTKLISVKMKTNN